MNQALCAAIIHSEFRVNITCFFVNIGMVMGLLPVVGVPLPLVSYGGSSLLIFMAGLGIIMSVQAHRKLIGS